MSLIAEVAAELVGIEYERDFRTDDCAQTFLRLRLADGQMLRVPTTDTRSPDTLLGGKGALSTRYSVRVELVGA